MNPLFSRGGRLMNSILTERTTAKERRRYQTLTERGEERERKKKGEEEGSQDKLQQQEKIQQKQLAQHQALSNCYDDGKC
ncbi:hypothetical protein CKAN_02023300 [Cinnamomum micranthum f. kanehirae]|uniref:Uncharacterized protein n=1 Tax=Cinnamomum micranthum f. kanehirae TaxID=337451 RepID=A0A3S3MW76_9MAGN|nr:hypothetical protein CKAN_02023300 [Cinnamomum micranthum f. kanehirae]